jgi:hypothetical protein
MALRQDRPPWAQPLQFVCRCGIAAGKSLKISFVPISHWTLGNASANGVQSYGQGKSIPEPRRRRRDLLAAVGGGLTPPFRISGQSQSW